MPKGFERLRYSVAERGDDELNRAGIRTLTTRGEPAAIEPLQFNSDEAAARFYLGRILSQDDRAPIRGLAAPDRPQHAPDMRLTTVARVPHSTDRLARFDQTSASIPIFGSRVVVQLDQNRELVSASGDVAHVSDVSPVAALSPQDALRRVVKFTGVNATQLVKVLPPELTFFHHDPDNTWHLAYHFKNVPAAPPEASTARGDHGLSPSPRGDDGSTNYLVDAHDGQVLFYFRSSPAAIEVPCICNGTDVMGHGQTFWGRKLESGAFELTDPLRHITTYDLQGHDIAGVVLPNAPVANGSSNFANVNSAAVSAHVHATHVHNFYNSVLQRDGIDDKKMELVSVVNCTYARGDDPPVWRNAVWWNSRMWYGQDVTADGTLRSLARFLDVIAHELTHGVTESTAALVYQGQSGALNESFSDIFGVLIANWIPTNPNRDVAAWSWTIGAGLGPDGAPLRDLSDPRATGNPAHMSEFVETADDYGGVHTNSNIHNKAVYNLLVATDAGGARVFEPTEIAVLMYLTLARLSSRATFVDALEALIDVANIYYAGNATERAARLGVIRDSYCRVGVVQTIDGTSADATAGQIV